MVCCWKPLRMLHLHVRNKAAKFCASTLQEQLFASNSKEASEKSNILRAHAKANFLTPKLSWEQIPKNQHLIWFDFISRDSPFKDINQPCLQLLKCRRGVRNGASDPASLFWRGQWRPHENTPDFSPPASLQPPPTPRWSLWQTSELKNKSL